ncbi:MULTISPECIES: hypothetical protein [unclassified Myxococcus]|uniref:hypothetical protein n=1 Tax=unclassified Myxococcus TaxID=2648731 RepID=UPI001CBE3374|nr:MULTISPECIES: hypothetical protein [unclassified Myxococcus]MBZ4395033.1 hypothetical protein [Myxococcus sp. AS-1-15]MBZ4406818.1 hypothetical protein [Myxococcus sp. XM-1-1-1]
MSVFVAACGSVEGASEAVGPPEVVEAQSAELRACSTSLDCRANCVCTNGVCSGGGFGPPPPAGYCDVPPVRACTTGADCASGCSCSNNVCVDNGKFSPPANCLVAPPDAYESDNSHTTASSYVGTPQLGHTFHKAQDADWVLGATSLHQLLTVEVYNLRNTGELRVDVHAYDFATRTLGALLASTQTLVCSDLTPSCRMFRTSVNVAPGVYAVKVTDTRTVPAGSDWRPTPTYDLKMY